MDPLLASLLTALLPIAVQLLRRYVPLLSTLSIPLLPHPDATPPATSPATGSGSQFPLLNKLFPHLFGQPFVAPSGATPAPIAADLLATLAGDLQQFIASQAAAHKLAAARLIPSTATDPGSLPVINSSPVSCSGCPASPAPDQSPLLAGDGPNPPTPAT